MAKGVVVNVGTKGVAAAMLKSCVVAATVLKSGGGAAGLCPAAGFGASVVCGALGKVLSTTGCRFVMPPPVAGRRL